MRGAPQVGLSTTIRKINSRTSRDVCLLPTCVLALEIIRQYKLKPARCHRTTISGETTISECFHSDQNRRGEAEEFVEQTHPWTPLPTLQHGELLAEREILESNLLHLSFAITYAAKTTALRLSEEKAQDKQAAH